MIYPESIGQEHIEAGVGIRINALDSLSQLALYTPLQAVAVHRGGQIGTIDTSMKVVTMFAAAGGVGIELRFANTWVNAIGVEGLVGYCNNADKNGWPYGKSISTKAFLKLKHGLALETAWWVGENFFAPTGAPLYQSRSSVYANENVYRQQRQLLFATASWRYEPKEHLEIDASLQPYYDMNLDLLEYAYRLRLAYRFSAHLKRLD